MYILFASLDIRKSQYPSALSRASSRPVRAADLNTASLALLNFEPCIRAGT